MALPAPAPFRPIRAESLARLEEKALRRRQEIRHGKCNPPGGKGAKRIEVSTAALAEELGGKHARSGVFGNGGRMKQRSSEN